MPITQRLISRGVRTEDNRVLRDSHGEEALPDKTFGETVGCLRQLSDLALFSNEIFAELLSLSANIGLRVESLSSRTAKLQLALPKLVVNKSAFDIHGDEIQHHRQMLQNPQSQHLVDRSTLPTAMQLRYCSRQVKPRLQFQVLDAYSKNLIVGPKAKTIAQRYSNPDFFLTQWCSVQVARMKQLEREKKQQKVDKKNRKNQRLAEASLEQRMPKRKSSVKWQERYMVDGKAVNRKSLAPEKSKGKRLSLMTSNSPVKREEEEDDGDSSVPSTPDVSGKFSPPRRPFQALSPLDRDVSGSNSGNASVGANSIPSGQSSPLVRYSAVYPSVSAKAKKALADSDQSEQMPLDGSEPASSPSSSAFGTPGGAVSSTNTPLPAEVLARLPQSKPAPPPPAQKAVSPPPPPVVVVVSPPAPAPPAPVAEMNRLSISKPDKPPKPVHEEEKPVAKVVAPPPPPGVVTQSSVPVPVPAPIPPAPTPAAVASPPPPPPPMAAAPIAAPLPSPPPPPKESQVNPPPPPAVPAAAPATVEEDSTASTPAETPKAPVVVDDGDSDSENDEDGMSPSVPVPVVAPPAARSHYLEDMMSGGAATSGDDVLGIMMGSAKRPPAPPPPPPVAPSTPAKGDHTPMKTLLKPRPVSQNLSSASSNRMSMRLNSTDSISSQLNAFALSFAGTALPEEMEVVPEHPHEDEIDVFAAVNSTKSTFAPPPPLPPAAAFGRVNLMDAIKSGGGGLRKVDEPSPDARQSSGRDSLMDAIKRGGGGLRKVSNEEKVALEEEKKRSASSVGGFGASSVTAILERRKFLMAEESDSDSDNDDSEWS